MSATDHGLRRFSPIRLARDERGVQLIEFAYSLPIWILLLLGGAEITNYTTTRMRISQVALHLADHAARIGAGSQLAAKTITETQINDALTGAGLQAGELNLYQNGRVIITDLEPIANPNPTDKYRIRWQRCRGTLNYAGNYAYTNAAAWTNLNGIGPTGQLVKVPNDNATIYVEVRYTYRPIIAASYAPALTITETAAMTVRDRRDLTQIYNAEGATIASCTTFSAS